jgi:alpha-glucosidase (family GH31 glycosyl hydrolase)
VTALRRSAVLLALTLVVPAPAHGATVAADAGSLRAVVGESPFSLALRSRGRVVLEQLPAGGPGPSGRLGFRSAGVWHHATAVLRSARVAGGYEATLATDDPLRTITVRIAAGREGVIRLTAELVGPAAGVEAMGIAFRAPRRERYLGFGERSNAVDQRGEVVESYAAEGAFQPEERPFVPNAFVPAWGFRGRDDATYFPMPWLVSTGGYGVLIDSTLTSYFRLASSRTDAWSLELTGAPPGAPEAASAPPTTALSLRFFAGPSPADVVRRLTRSIGRQPPPEPWYLGPWFQRTGEDELADARALRRADAPVSVYQTYLHYLPCGDQQGIEAEQPARTARLHALGYAVTTYFNPMICVDYSPAYERAEAAGALTETMGGSPYVYRYNEFVVSQFDFSAAAGRNRYVALLAEALGDGYDGWMEDFGEYTPLDSRSADGTLGYEMHNRYPRLYHCAAWDWAQRQRKPLLRYIRSGWTGAARCAPVVWNGDPTTDWGFDGLRSAVQNALSAGLSGVGVWGSDIGGFFALGARRLTPELLIRWVQLGAVSAAMRTQANGFSLPPKDRPQVTDPDQIANWRRYTKLHTQLSPLTAAPGCL